MKRTHRITGFAMAFVLALAACTEDATAPQYEAVYEVEVAGEKFHIALESAAQIAAADALLASGAEQNVHGTLKRGNGGFNMSYSWHLEPSTVTFPDVTMEICDGRPNSEVEAEVDYFIETVKYYCPWGAKIVRKVQ
jgi:hypothetical protein